MQEDRPPTRGRSDPEGSAAFGPLLEQMRGLFPPTLLAGVGWDRVLAAAHRLPLSLIDFRFGFEFNLWQEEPGADFFVCVPHGSRIASHYIRQGERAGRNSPEAALGAFLATSGTPESFLARARGSIMLEYDLMGIPPLSYGAPGVFIVPQDEGQGPILKEPVTLPELVAALALAAGQSQNQVLVDRVQQLFDGLPDPKVIAQAGMLPSRKQRGARLIVQGLAPEKIPDALVGIGWTGDPSSVEAVLADMAGVSRIVGVSLDQTEAGVSPRIGLEFFRPVKWHDVDASGWRTFIDCLEERGLCLPSKAAGLRQWPTHESVFGKDDMYKLLRFINHVKVVVHEGRSLAKAYLGVFLQPFKWRADDERYASVGYPLAAHRG